ncbi:MAG: hypothetical protein JSV29_05975 [Candidatus Bathyarchaeota archaeon]|nr:MAG: hypothetical protein JSV29_05975 [Candidatus Bathyarchaeota archaeon]
MQTKRLLLFALSLLCLAFIPLLVQATSITLCTFDKDTYHQGETGYITVTIYNDKESKIRITELTATINYYYTDSSVYVQKFFTNETLPTEIPQGQSDTFYVRFSLPTNIASGYTNVEVRAKTELWNEQTERWFGSENPTHQLTLFIESPYKQQSEDYQQQLDKQQEINKNTTAIMYLIGSMTTIFAAATIFLFILYRRASFTAQPVA